MQPEAVGERVAEYLAGQWGAAVSAVATNKIFGGASRETYMLALEVAGEPRQVVVRRDPVTSLIDTERALEFNAYCAAHASGVIPVPEPLFLEEDPQWLGQPFSVMAAIEDSVTDVTALDDDGRQQLGEQKWSILGRLAALDVEAAGFTDFLEPPERDACWLRELDYWAAVINDDEMHPQPIAQAALRWLRRNPPPAAQKLSVVHGDYRTGNFLHRAGQGINGILDWEMCHLGDPYEDLAWSLDPLWRGDQPGLAGRLLPQREAVEHWQAASGLDFDPDAFRWWRVFVAVKAVAIWISSSHDFANGESKDAILATAGWVMTSRQNQILLDYLSPHSTHEREGDWQ